MHLFTAPAVEAGSSSHFKFIYFSLNRPLFPLVFTGANAGRLKHTIMYVKSRAISSFKIDIEEQPDGCVDEEC